MDIKLYKHFIQVSQTISPKLELFIREHGAIPLKRRWDLPLIAVLARAVTGQLLSAKAATTIWSRMEAARDNNSHSAFYSKSSIKELRSYGLSNSKAKTIQAIVQAENENLINEKKLKKLNSNERQEILTSIWGVGVWTAQMMEIFYFLEEDIWPEGDVAVQNSLTTLTSKRRNNTKTAEKFAPYRSYLATYMWAYTNQR